MVRAGVAEHPDRGRVELSLLRLLRHGEVMPKQARFAEKSRKLDSMFGVSWLYPVSDDDRRRTTIGTRG
jgi:hypothetical protein